MAELVVATASGPLALIIGQRWSLAVVEVLLDGPRRFGALKAAIPGLSANLLTCRLQALRDAGIIEHRELSTPASVHVYALTSWGVELGPILMQLDRWTARSSPARELLSGPSIKCSCGASR